MNMYNNKTFINIKKDNVTGGGVYVVSYLCIYHLYIFIKGFSFLSSIFFVVQLQLKRE